MKFISAEEFLKQPKEVQKVFLDWWKCDNGDLYVNNYELKTEGNYCNVRCCNIELESNLEGEWEWFKDESTPLLTEGQIRKFIEDKTNGHVDLAYYAYKENGFRGYTLETWLYNPYKCTKQFKDLGDNLLQAYWQVALKIIEEELKQ